MLLTFLKAIGIADILDIALVSVAIYAMLVWFKRARAAVVAKGMLVVTAVYMLASASGMVMTTSIFHALFAIILVALVVIFQEELRSTFEKIAVWSLSGGNSAEEGGGAQADELVQALWDMSRERIGALIVLCGTDPLDRHLEGGWRLGGEYSEAVLRSIFDDHSIGHDGAVVIEGRKIVHFGCRLPLSKEFSKTARLGTRHTAALGLSELTDALCIVVSEERGMVSVAHEGRLESIRKLADLQKRVSDFTLGSAPQSKEESVHAFLKKNTREKAVAVSASVLLWALFVLGMKTTERVFHVPVVAENMPPELMVANASGMKVRLTYTGQMRHFYRVREGHLSVRLDMSQAHAGSNRLRLAEAEFPRPVGLALQEISPTVIDVAVAAKGASKKVSLWR